MVKFFVSPSKLGFSKQGPRFSKHGENSGEEFVNDYLVFVVKTAEANKKKFRLVIDFSETEHFSPSFIDEIIVGLIRNGYKNIVKKIKAVKGKNDYEKEWVDYFYYIKKKNLKVVK